MLAMIITILFSMSYLHQSETQKSTMEKGAISSLGRLILSTNLQERRLAYNFALNKLIGFKRDRLKPFLIEVVRADPLMPPKVGPLNGEEATYSPKRIALSILAEWNDVSLIPFFLEYLDFQAPDPNRSSKLRMGRIRNDEYAAVKGLIVIGKPAIEPCLRELAGMDRPTDYMRVKEPKKYDQIIGRYENLIYVLWGILDYEETRQLFKKEFDRVEKSDPVGAKRMRDANDYLQTYFRNNE